MTRFVVSRLIGLVLTLLVTSFLIFGGLYLSPGGPLAYLLGGRTASPQQIARVTAQYHLDQPLATRYLSWLSDVLHGRLGTSLVFRQGVWGLLEPRIGTTAFLVCYAAVIIVLLGVTLGTLSAIRGGGADRAITTVATAGLATPSFVAATILIAVFAVQLGWFPVFGSGTGFFDTVRHLTLPAVALAFAGTAYIARVTRSAVNGELHREHVETARSRGLSERRVIFGHVLRNALIPITTVAGLTIASLIAGSVVVETAFGLNGLGSFLVSSVHAKDYSVVQAISMILVVAFVLTNIVVDLLYAVIDPRVRVGRGP